METLAVPRYHPSTARLLIEPLWNGNAYEPKPPISPLFLLIEPLWNGNVGVAVSATATGALLIEPLWNGNLSGGLHAALYCPTSNRTIVEWKQHAVIDFRLRVNPF